MFKLYDLTDRYKNLLDLLSNKEVDKNVLYNSLDLVQEDIGVKVENTAKVLKSIELEAKALKEEEERIKKRRQALERNYKNLKEYVQESLLKANLSKIKTKLFTVYFRKTKKIVLYEEQIDLKYKKIVEQTDIASIRIDLEEGKEVKGAKFVENESLIIR